MAQQTIKSRPFINPLHRVRGNRSFIFGAIIVTALLAFEIFNYSTTDYALTDLLGELSFMGLRWSTVLAIAFCGIDFAGIARLFSPDMTKAQNENWFLFGAWLLAAAMNAMLTWWGVSLAILSHETAGDAVIARETMLHVGPIFVSILVWLIRVLIIGTFSVAGDRLFNLADEQLATQNKVYRPISRPEMTVPRTSATRSAATRSVPSRSTLNDLPSDRDEGLRLPLGRSSATRSAHPVSQPKPSVPVAVPHTYSAVPRRYSSLPEPEYSDELDGSESIEIINPRYLNAPLAARSAERPGQNPTASTESNSSHNSSPRRQF